MRTEQKAQAASLRNGYEVICPDRPLYGYTEYSTAITYDTWVRCGRDIVSHYQRQQARDIFLFGLSAGGMLAYQVACECKDIRGIMVSCIPLSRKGHEPKVYKTNTLLPERLAEAGAGINAGRYRSDSDGRVHAANNS